MLWSILLPAILSLKLVHNAINNMEKIEIEIFTSCIKKNEISIIKSFNLFYDKVSFLSVLLNVWFYIN